MAEQYLERSIVREGNLQPLKAVMKKAAAGEAVTIGYLGGSITMGSVASTPEKCYAYLSHLWWKETFPQSQVNYVNAGIGATTSQFAAARCEDDLLRYQPDVVFVEFSVNDEDTAHFEETYEGLVRRLLNRPDAPAVILLHNSFLDSGRSAFRIHNNIGAYYHLPAVSIRANLYERIRDGEISAQEVTADFLHPNDKGHAILAETVVHFLHTVYEKTEEPDVCFDFVQKPLTANRYESSLRLQNRTLEPAMNEGFQVDPSVQNGIGDVFKNGYEAFHDGDRMIFTLDTVTIALQYRRTIQKPAPKARVVIDGREDEAVILDGEFDETWGDLIALTTVWEGSERAKHRVEITVQNEHPEVKSGFYLVAVLYS